MLELVMSLDQFTRSALAALGTSEGFIVCYFADFASVNRGNLCYQDMHYVITT
jgi:hypothetical protein